jgi:hypothetical protein
MGTATCMSEVSTKTPFSRTCFVVSFHGLDVCASPYSKQGHAANIFLKVARRLKSGDWAAQRRSESAKSKERSPGALYQSVPWGVSGGAFPKYR